MRGTRRRDMGATTYFDIGSTTYFLATKRHNNTKQISIDICVAGRLERPACEFSNCLLRTAAVGLDGIRCINQSLPLSLSERVIVDERVDLIGEGVYLATSRARLTFIELDA